MEVCEGRFSGQAAPATGGGSGLGRELAVRLAEEGADVAVVDLNEDSGRATGYLSHSARRALLGRQRPDGTGPTGAAS
jgi:NAD(P)-dependent dehydrogenase (short-subunit alcohol dehydrogenase family)